MEEIEPKKLDELVDMPEELNVTRERVMAFVRLVLGFASGACTYFGLYLDWNFTATVCTGLITIIFFVWAWWKNNNVTRAAVIGQSVTDGIKASEDDLYEDDDE